MKKLLDPRSTIHLVSLSMKFRMQQRFSSLMISLLLFFGCLVTLGMSHYQEAYRLENLSEKNHRMKVYQFLNSQGYQISSEKYFYQLWDTLKEASHLFEIDFETLLSLGLIESGLNARAISPKGAQGVFQIRPSTAEAFWKDFQIKSGALGLSRYQNQSFSSVSLVDTRVSIYLGTFYLAHLKSIFQDRTHLALAAYNVGPSALRKSLKQGEMRGRDYISRVYQMRRQIRALREKPSQSLAAKVVVADSRF